MIFYRIPAFTNWAMVKSHTTLPYSLEQFQVQLEMEPVRADKRRHVAVALLLRSLPLWLTPAPARTLDWPSFDVFKRVLTN
jgi:hypothetical protein